MKSIFGVGKNKPPPPSLTDAAAGVENRGETVEKKIAKLDGEIAKYRTEMAKMRDGPSKNMLKQKAMRCLRQKKVYETQLGSLSNQAFNLEQANFAIDTVRDTKTTVSAMKAGVKSFKKEMKGVNLTDVENIFDDMADMQDEVNDLQEILGQPMGMPDIDEGELEAEFEALGADMDWEADSKYIDDALKVPSMPSVSTSVPTEDPGGVSQMELQCIGHRSLKLIFNYFGLWGYLRYLRDTVYKSPAAETPSELAESDVWLGKKKSSTDYAKVVVQEEFGLPKTSQKQ